MLKKIWLKIATRIFGNIMVEADKVQTIRMEHEKFTKGNKS